MQPLQSETKIICKLVSRSIEMCFECVKNIVEPNARGTTLNYYPGLCTQRIQPVTEYVSLVDEENSIVASARLDIRAGLPTAIVDCSHKAIFWTPHEDTVAVRNVGICS